MPRANRYIVPGFDYHLTHRCHDRQFLLKFALDRHLYRIRLRQALLDCRVALLTYNITHNRRKQRTGAFWEGRYHVTMVDSGTYLWDCLLYIELNRVRCGAVGHPSQWEWSGYREMMGARKRNRLLNIDKRLELLGAPSLGEFREHLLHGLNERIEKRRLERQAMWTEALAVGSRPFVEAMKHRIHHRPVLETLTDGGAWVLREDYGPVFRPKN